MPREDRGADGLSRRAFNALVLAGVSSLVAFITRVQQKTSRPAAEVPPSEFRRLVARILDVQAFELKSVEG